MKTKDTAPIRTSAQIQEDINAQLKIVAAANERIDANEKIAQPLREKKEKTKTQVGAKKKLIKKTTPDIPPAGDVVELNSDGEITKLAPSEAEDGTEVESKGVENNQIDLMKIISHTERVKKRMEEIKERQSALVELIQYPSNHSAIEENNELGKEALSLEKELERIKKEFPELKTPKEVKEQEEKIEMSQLRVELKQAEAERNEEQVEIIENKIRALENKIRGKDTKLPNQEQIQKEKEEKEKLLEDLRKAEEENQKKENLKIEQKLNEARDKYFEEYKQCKKEVDRQSLISKTKNTILNFFRSKESKKQIKVEDFFTDKLRESKKEYDKSRIEMGNYMYNKKKAELEKAGLSGEDLEKALKEYKATEILAKTIIDERQKLIDKKAEGAPIKPALWKRLIDGYLKIKPRWKRVALSTLIFLPVAASGAFGASIIAGYGIAGLAAVKFASSMAIGAVAGNAAKGIDWAKRGADAKFAETQADKKLKLKERFSKGEIGLEEYEKDIETYEAEEKKRARNRTLLKMGVGFAIAGTAGFLAYDALGNGIPQTAGVENNVDAISGPDVGHIVDTPSPKIEHLSIEATANDGQGAISTLRELQQNLKVEYGDNLENAPASVRHILGTDAHKLAQEYGMYKPGQDAESVFMKSGSFFKVDENGDVTFHESANSDGITLQEGSAIKAGQLYEGKMFDSDHSGVKIEDTDNTAGTPDEYKLPLQVDPTTGEPVTTEADSSNLVDDKYKLPPQVDPVTGELPDSVPEGNGQQILSGESRTGYVLTAEEMTEVKQTYEQNIYHIFGDEQQLPGGIWDKIQGRISAEKLMEMDAKNQISPEYKPLTDYMEKLKETSGLEPRGITPVNPEAETIPEYMNRALEKIQQEGRLDEIKLSSNYY